MGAAVARGVKSSAQADDCVSCNKTREALLCAILLWSNEMKLTDGCMHLFDRLFRGLSEIYTAPAAAPASSVARPNKRKRESVDEGAEAASSSASSSSSSFPGVCLGVNAVTRAASAGELRLVLLCRSVTPLLLISHLPIVCQMKQIPLLTLHPHINTRMLAQAIEAATKDDAAAALPSSSKSTRLQLCTTIGIRKGALESTAASLAAFASIPKLAWLTTAAGAPLTAAQLPKYQPVNVLHTETEGKKGGKGGGGGGGGGGGQKQQKQPQEQQKNNRPGEDVAMAAATAAASTKPAAVVGRIESATQRKKKQKLLNENRQS